MCVQIALVAHHVGARVGCVRTLEKLCLFVFAPVGAHEPVVDVVKRGAFGHIKYVQENVRSAKVAGRDGAETLLARSVPNLKTYHVSSLFGRDLQRLKVHANGGLFILSVWIGRIVDQPFEQAGFAHTGCTAQHHLDHFVKRLVFHFLLFTRKKETHKGDNFFEHVKKTQ